jgi:hypothetical protein
MQASKLFASEHFRIQQQFHQTVDFLHAVTYSKGGEGVPPITAGKADDSYWALGVGRGFLLLRLPPGPLCVPIDKAPFALVERTTTTLPGG